MASTEQDARKTTALMTAKSLMVSLTVGDLQRSLRFYTEGLGFGVEASHERDGEVRYYALRAGECQLGIGQDDWAKGRDRVKGVGMRIYISTDQDVHEIAKRVQSAGFKVDSGPEPLPWGPMAFHLTDPDGFLLTVGND